MARKKATNIQVQVFKGREARLNRVIFGILSGKAPLAIWDMHKQIIQTKGFKRTRYAVVNVRVKALHAQGYLRKTGERETKHGLKTDLFDISARAQLAIALNSRNIDDLVNALDEDATLTILYAILSREKPLE
jgi:hypothetical protein